MDPSSDSYLKGMSGVGQLLLENEKTKRKLRKVQQRRDYYAKLYFQTATQLEQAQAELDRALSTITALRCRDHTNVDAAPSVGPRPPHSDTTTPDSGASFSPGVDSIDSSSQMDGRHLSATNQRLGRTSITWSNDLITTITGSAMSPCPKSQYCRTEHQPQHHPPLSTCSEQLPWCDPPGDSPPGEAAPPKFPLTRPPIQLPPAHQHCPITLSSYPPSNTHPHIPLQRPVFRHALTGPHFENLPVDILQVTHSSSLSPEEVQDGNNGRNSPTSSAAPAFEEEPEPNYRASGLEANCLSIAQPARTSGSVSHTSTSRGEQSRTPWQPSQCKSVSSDCTHCSCDRLSTLQLLDILSIISAPDCPIQTLEIKNSKLGEAKLMALFCKDLECNESITKLSLPENGIDRASLTLLLETVNHKDNVKELVLRNNAIGRNCAALIKGFLTDTSLDSLVMTGNEIEQFGHLLCTQLPSEFALEYSTDGSEDSGIHVASPPSTSHPLPDPQHCITTAYKHLRI